MQRLTRRLSRRLDDERGATAAMFALLLVPMLGFAAIAVDIGALYAERARLQVGADAAAIAVAQDCSRGNCGDMLATAQGLITANDTEGTAAQPVLSSDPLSVTVTGGTPKEHWFAPVIGHDSTQVSATATVGWGSPSGGTAVLPLTFSWCSFEAQTDGGVPSDTTLQMIKLSKSAEDECPGPSGNVVPGGFGVLETDGATGAVTRRIDQLTSSTGNNPPPGSDGGPDRAPADLRRLRRPGEPRLVPGLRLRRLQDRRVRLRWQVQHREEAVREDGQRPVCDRLLHPFRRAVRRLELQPDRPDARGLHPPTDPIRGDHS
jgi:Flp pilus assembly protein TadG